MATKRFSSSPGSHGRLETKFSGPGGKYEQKIRQYFTAKGKPDSYQYTPAEGREAMNYIKHVDRNENRDSWGSSGSSFLQGAASDVSDNYKDSILGRVDSESMDDYLTDKASDKTAFQDLIAGENETELDRNEMDSEALDDWLTDQSSERTSGIDDISSSGPDLYKQKYTSNLSGGLLDSEALADLAEDEASGEPGPSLLDYDEDLEAFDSSPDETSWWEELTESGGESKGLSSNQKIAAKLITDIFGEKEERPQQSIGASPLTQGRALDMSQYSSARPKKDRYRNMGLLGRA